MEFEKQLQGLMNLQDPGTAFTEKVVAIARVRLKGGSKARRRLFVIGTFLVFAAAAAIMGVWLMESPPNTVVAMVTDPVPDSAEIVIASDFSEPDIARQAGSDQKQKPEPASEDSASVVVWPLQKDGSSAAHEAEVGSVYGSFLEILRNTEGVTLVEAESAVKATGQPVEYGITVHGRGEISEGKIPISMEIVTHKTNGSRRQTMTTHKLELAPGCVSAPLANGLTTPTTPCADVQGTAIAMVGFLRTKVFPSDPLSLDALQRLRGLMDPESRGKLYYGRNPVNPVQIAAKSPQANTLSGSADSEAHAAMPQRLGIGFELTNSEQIFPNGFIGKILVKFVVPGTVAQKAGVLQGDVLLEVDGKGVIPVNVNKIVEAVPKGIDFDLMVYRLGEKVKLKAQF